MSFIVEISNSNYLKVTDSVINEVVFYAPKSYVFFSRKLLSDGIMSLTLNAVSANDSKGFSCPLLDTENGVGGSAFTEETFITFVETNSLGFKTASGGSGAVDSVNGQTGAVVLTAGNLPDFQTGVSSNTDVSSNKTEIANITNSSLYNFNEVTTQTLYPSSTDLELTDMAQTITTLKDNQRVIIRIMLNYECNHEGSFYIKVGGVEVGSAISGGRRGIASCSYDVDNDSTMMNTYIQYSYIESVAGTKSFTLNRRGVSASVALNRTIRNSANDETATSSVEIELKP